MSVVVAPEWLTAAAEDVAEVGSAIDVAYATAASPTTGLLAAAGDEVSTTIAALFSAHGQGYQALSAQAALFHERFVQSLTGASGAYAAAEAFNAAPLASFEQTLLAVQQAPAALANEVTRVADILIADVFGAQAAPPFPATQTGGYTGTPSLLTRFEETALLPLKPLLTLSGLEPQLANTSNPLFGLLSGDVPILSLAIGNSPPQFLTLLLGETVQHSTYQGMDVVQITPAHPSGEYVVAIHGGAFIFPPSIFHWLDYTVMAHQTGATIEVPIYPLLQQGGTAGTVVPKMAGLISDQVTQHGSSNVSVIGDSAGGNLALAAVNMLAADPTHPDLPSAMVLLSPWLDLGMTNPNIGLVQDPLLPVGAARLIGTAWADGLPMDDPMVSPLYGHLSSVPTYVYSGNMDILSPDALRLQQIAVDQLAPVSFVLANGQIHDWIILTPDGPGYWPQIDQELGL